jgi:hypothetical protein
MLMETLYTVVPVLVTTTGVEETFSEGWVKLPWTTACRVGEDKGLAASNQTFAS